MELTVEIKTTLGIGMKRNRKEVMKQLRRAKEKNFLDVTLMSELRLKKIETAITYLDELELIK